MDCIALKVDLLCMFLPFSVQHNHVIKIINAMQFPHWRRQRRKKTHRKRFRKPKVPMECPSEWKTADSQWHFRINEFFNKIIYFNCYYQVRCEIIYFFFLLCLHFLTDLIFHISQIAIISGPRWTSSVQTHTNLLL